jgi:hypothetical protein
MLASIMQETQRGAEVIFLASPGVLHRAELAMSQFKYTQSGALQATQGRGWAVKGFFERGL